VDPHTTAVLAIHWQRDIVRRDGAFGDFYGQMVERTGIVERTARVLASARERRVNRDLRECGNRMILHLGVVEVTGASADASWLAGSRNRSGGDATFSRVGRCDAAAVPWLRG
jgi:hypothetical protein